MTIEIAFPLIALAIAGLGALYFRHGARKIDESRKNDHPAE